MEIQGSRVLLNLMHAYKNRKGDDGKSKYIGYVLPGGSRSTKTWSIIQFLIVYCQQNKGKGKDILIARQQYSDLKRTLMRDFFKILNIYKIYDEKKHGRSHPQNYELFGNMIYFSGLDSGGSHGEAYDIVWINEAFESDQEAFRQLNQRLREFFILDYNPYFTEHWILDSVNTRDNVWVAPVSTQLDNPWLPERTRNEILAYDPSNPINVANGTADDFMWKVYGLGQGAQHEGAIFKYVNWIDKFPDGIDYWYGCDWGFTVDPTVIVKTGIHEGKIYFEELCYEPVDHPRALSDMMKGLGIEPYLPIIADSSDKYGVSSKGGVEMVKDLRSYGWNIEKVRKTHDKVFWINKLKEYGHLNIVHSVNWKKEQQHYRWRTVNGIMVNQPMDKDNHCWDAALYSIMKSNHGRRRIFR